MDFSDGVRYRTLMQTLFDLLDQRLINLLPKVPERDRWLLKQTLYTGSVRRAVLKSLPIQRGQAIADVGCGFGATAIELSHLHGCSVTGIDRDATVLQWAHHIMAQLPTALPVRLVAQDVLTVRDPSPVYDGAISRFVMQHLSDPEAALRILFHWLKPGGFLYVEDIDDGWTIEHPPAPEPWQKVVSAFRALQRQRGGDRYIGRKLAAYFESAGFADIQPVIRPMSAYLSIPLTDASVQFELERVANELPAMIDARLLTAKDWARGKKAFLDSYPKAVFVSNASLHIMARRPGA